MNKLLLLCVLFSLQTLIASADTGEKSLYTAKDHVLELNISNFDATVYNQSRAFFVEFYASWCGHCIHYKPTFSQFAKNLRSWSRIVQVVVINCAAEENSPLCRKHSIAAFPTLKYFKVGAKSKDDVEIYNEDKYNLPEMTRIVTDWAHKDYEAKHPVGWPKLEPTADSTTLADLWSGAPPSAAVVALVVDNAPYKDGYATLINYHNDPVVHAALVDKSHPLATQFGGVAVPAVHIFKRDNPHSPSYSSNEAMDFIKIKEQVDKSVDNFRVPGVQNQAIEPPVQHLPTETIAVKADWSQFEVQYLDLTSALSYMLTQEIPRRNRIDGKYIKVLKDWIHVLHLYLPLSAPVRRLFYRLDEYLKTVHTITADNWLAHVQQYQDELGHPLPKTGTYLACRGSKPFLRGYTCGLWTLFHVVTVDAYKQNKHDPSFRPYNDVLEPLHQFIYNYLSCSECAKNFDKMARETLAEVRTPEDTVLWLWKAHNKVNNRLAGQSTQDPAFPKQQFPPTAVCQRCRTPSGDYDEAEVLNFLINYYSNVKTDNVRPAPAYKVNNYEDGKLKEISNKHLNPKFLPRAGKVDKLEEAEARLNEEKGREWNNPNYLDTEPQTADRKAFYLIWLAIVGLAVFGYFRYRKIRSRFWKYCNNDYKFLPWRKNSSSNLMKYMA